MVQFQNVNAFPNVPAGGLPAPSYTNPAQASAVAACRRDGGTLFRVTAIYDRTGERFGYDLPPYDADLMARELSFNKGYSDVTLCRVRGEG